MKQLNAMGNRRHYYRSHGSAAASRLQQQQQQNINTSEADSPLLTNGTSPILNQMNSNMIGMMPPNNRPLPQHQMSMNSNTMMPNNLNGYDMINDQNVDLSLSDPQSISNNNSNNNSNGIGMMPSNSYMPVNHHQTHQQGNNQIQPYHIYSY
jgi:hypothetical protein